MQLEKLGCRGACPVVTCDRELWFLINSIFIAGLWALPPRGSRGRCDVVTSSIRPVATQSRCHDLFYSGFVHSGSGREGSTKMQILYFYRGPWGAKFVIKL